MNTDFLEETHEDEMGQKLAGLTGETFGNWLCIQYLFVSEQLRGQRIGSKLSFQMPTFYKNHGYQEVFTLEEYPYTGKRYYYTKKLFSEETANRMGIPLDFVVSSLNVAK